MSGTLAMLTNWYLVRQRPHHLLDAANAAGLRVDVFSHRALSAVGAAPPPPNRLHERLVPPSRFHSMPVLRRVGPLVHDGIVQSFAAAEADIHVFATAPWSVPERKPPLLVYDCMDDWSAFPGADERIRRNEERLCAMADRIWATSRVLAERLAARYGPKVDRVPNGADSAHFARAAALRAGRKRAARTLGYVGAVAEWFDVDLVAGVADALPDWRIEVLGPVELSPARLARLQRPNVTVCGRVPYEQLPERMAAWDVGMIPFVVTELIKATNPIKLYEYLAAGLPVVSSSMPEVLPLVEEGVVACADDAASFADAVARLAESDRAERRRQVASQHSWEQRFREAIERARAGA